MVITEPIFKQYKLLKVNHILQNQMQEFKCYHKFKNSTMPAYLQQLKLLPNSSIHSHNTRTYTYTEKHIRLQNNAFKTKYTFYFKKKQKTMLQGDTNAMK